MDQNRRGAEAPSNVKPFGTVIPWDVKNAALANLRDYGDSYKTRRNKEADLLEGIYGA